MNDILLDDKNNYYEKYFFVEKDIFIKYFKIITEYVEHLKNIDYVKCKNIDFFISHGLKTITNIFKLIMIYSKNLDLTYNYSKKAIYYYVEFIKQLDIETNYLKLSPIDISLFVYNKTIFLIDNEFRKKYVSKNYYIENNFKLFIDIIYLNFDCLLNDILIYSDLTNVYNDIFMISSHIIDLSNKSSSKNINSRLTIIYQFNKFMVSMNIENYIFLFDEFCNKKIFDYDNIFDFNYILFNNINNINNNNFICLLIADLNHSNN